MKQEQIKFLLQEYEQAEVSPQYIRLNGKTYLIPMDYYADFEDFQQAFINDFFDAMRRDYQRYKENGEPVKYLTFQDEEETLRLVVPYDWRMENRSKREVVARIFNRAERKYNRVMDYTLALQKATGKKLLSSYVGRDNLRALKAEMVARGLEKSVPQKVRQILQTACAKTKNNPKWSLENLRLSARKWFVRVSLAATLSGAGYVAFHGEKTDDSQIKTEQLKTQDSQKPNVPLKQSVPLLDEVLLSFKSLELDEEDFGLNSVEKHNKKLFEKCMNDMICYIAFVEDFKAEAYNDKKGVPTVGYGTTYYLNEKGQKTRKVQYGDKITIDEAAIQTERYLKHIIWPLIEKNVQVKLDSERLITTAQFAYLLNPKSFVKSAYLKGLNQGYKGKKLANLMTEYSKDKGVSKRCLPAVYMMEGRISVKDLLELHAASVYNCPYDLVVMCKKNGKRVKDKNHIGCFKTDEESANRVLQILGSSYHGKLSPTKNILPSQVVKNVKKKGTSLFSTFQFAER